MKRNILPLLFFLIFWFDTGREAHAVPTPQSARKKVPTGHIEIPKQVISNPTKRALKGRATQSPSPENSNARKKIQALRHALSLHKVRLKSAFQELERSREALLKEWLEIASIPAPSGFERRRGVWIAKRFQAFGLKVSTDKMGNVIGRLPGRGGVYLKKIVLCAHLDTVFGKKTPIKLRRKRHMLYGPGVGDDAAGLIDLIAVARLISRHRLSFQREIWFVATVQEELGLIGASYLMKEHRQKIGMVISVDGGYGGISYGAMGIHWWKIFFRGKSRHTLSSTHRPSTTHAVALAISRLYLASMLRRKGPKVWMNVGRLGAGPVVNAQAKEAWFTVDLRALQADALMRLGRETREIVEAVARRLGLNVEIKILQKLPAVQLKGMREHLLVRSTAAILRMLGVKKVHLGAGGANDHCAALALGIPAINIGIARARYIHSLREQVDTRPMLKGIKQTLLLLSILAQLEKNPPAR